MWMGDLDPIDYVARWRALVDRRVDQGRRFDRLHDRPDEWAGARAARFQAIVGGAADNDPLLRHLAQHVRATDTILDIGAGPGRHAIPLARQAARVIAVEPSAGMREQLRQSVQREGLTNLEIVSAGWLDAEVEPADVVICSHVVYGVADIERFVRKLDAATRRHAVMVLRFGQREAPTLELFAQIWGEKRGLAPTCLDLLGVLAQIEIYPNLAVVPLGLDSPRASRFSDLEEAVAQIRADLLNPASPEAEAIIRANLASRLVPLEDGFDLPRAPSFAGILWWEKPAVS